MDECSNDLQRRLCGVPKGMEVGTWGGDRHSVNSAAYRPPDPLSPFRVGHGEMEESMWVFATSFDERIFF